jgi:hypothetical protein
MSCTPRLLPLTLCFPLAALAFGCTSEDQSGLVVVAYAFDSTADCDALGVTQVRATLRGGLNPSATAPCNLAAGITLENVNAANYGLTVEALDAVGDTIYDNLGFVGSPPMDQPIEVLGGVSNSYDAVLWQTPATVRMAFQIVDEDGFFLQAVNAEIKEFETVARRGTVPMVTHVYDYGTAKPNEAMADPERRIEGNLLDAVRVQPRGANGQSIGGVIEVPVEPPGHGKAVQIRIDCVETDCMGTVQHSGSDIEDDDSGDPDTAGTGDAGTGG